MKYIFKKFVVLILVTFAASLHLSVYSQDNVHLVETNELNLSVSVGFGGLENPLIDAKNTLLPVIPHLSYYGDKWYIEDFSIGYSLIEEPGLIIDLFTDFNEDGFFFELNGLENFFITSQIPSGPGKNGGLPSYAKPIERKVSYLAGVSILIPNEFATLKFSHLRDISGVHNGYETHISLSKVYSLFSGDLALELGAKSKDDKIANYYYMVRPGEFLTRISSYSINTIYNSHMKLAYWRKITNDWALDLQLTRTRLDSELAATPFIKQQYYYSGFIGFHYRF
ncbi:MipA/OmpV family protein [Pseudoalteromonas sp. MMG010]|uniref:MipA/OmpV family protein n=1 Tax=Pseudoalteromonas sp. MMG010 TaxID=2822685 RepID=UPI001B3A2832|nr:MipA/OmpV family protein [Pseudoalteromonas sp. MMG010]MBQ4832148.1 MipA/OmpV family protein [Pseudoalteromonas sp. MMG010]